MAGHFTEVDMDGGLPGLWVVSGLNKGVGTDEDCLLHCTPPCIFRGGGLGPVVACHYTRKDPGGGGKVASPVDIKYPFGPVGRVLPIPTHIFFPFFTAESR